MPADILCQINMSNFDQDLDDEDFQNLKEHEDI